MDYFQEKSGTIYLLFNTSKRKRKILKHFNLDVDQVASYPLKVIASPEGIDYGKTYEEILAMIKNELTFFFQFEKCWLKNYLKQKKRKFVSKKFRISIQKNTTKYCIKVNNNYILKTHS